MKTLEVMRNIEIKTWFAIYPVKLDNGKWAWLRKIKVTTDWNDFYYLGLLERKTYSEL